MRQTPRRVIFPALRLIRERQKRSKKRLRVKNWLLLLARMALLALMALALARPRLTSEASIGDVEVPTALGFVFDTSLSMGYKQTGKTRLEEAKERALEILKKTPSSSAVYVVDSANPILPTMLSPAFAKKQIEGLTIRNVSRPLNVAVGLAYTAIADSDKPRHEVYIFTDLARSAWDLSHPVEGLEKAAKDKIGMKTYVLRLTPKDAHDVAVVEARPTADVVTEGEPVGFRAQLRALGPAVSLVAKLYLDNVPKEEKQVTIPANGEIEVPFMPQKVDATSPVHQGKVVLSGVVDDLDFDDCRYFTFKVQPATNVLVVADELIDAEFIANAIAPDPRTLPPGTPRPFRAEKIQTARLPDKADGLSKNYRAIFLNNVNGRQLSDQEWTRLSGFVLDGGGLVIGLGRRSDGGQSEGGYRGPIAGEILPATLDKTVTLKQPTNFGHAADYTHPLFNKYAKPLDEVLSQVLIFKYWSVTLPAGTSSRVLLSYADKAPALIERVFKGRLGRDASCSGRPRSRAGPIPTRPTRGTSFRRRSAITGRSGT